ncbi:MAG: hypothetical protein JNL66_19360 [Alphaproteobacteria bacterium]|nr:hypothetical protein [Alphaproteobacteria bacterium]
MLRRFKALPQAHTRRLRTALWKTMGIRTGTFGYQLCSNRNLINKKLQCAAALPLSLCGHRR